MVSRGDLLRPFALSLRNRFCRQGRLSRGVVIAVLGGMLLCLALYLVTGKVVRYFHGQNELGVILSLKIFQMAWIILFAMAVFSCMVSAVSTIFLSQDNEIVIASPTPPETVFHMRYWTTTVYTAWMMVVFSIPVFGAYGAVFAAGPLYWPLMLAAVCCTALSATAAGCLATIVLVNLFPARRTRDIILYLSLCFGLFLYLLFRLMRPEDLVNPDKYGHFVEYLSAIAAPAGPYLPAAWAANLLSAYLLDQRVDWLLLALLLLTPAALFTLGEWAMARWFFPGYTKAQESFGGFRRFSGEIAAASQPWRWIFRKETKLFFRDSAEWSQLFMIAALTVVYLYNFKLLPMERSYLAVEYLANLISFLNIGLTGFMVASLAGRFVFPSIGNEGGAFWLIAASPLSLRGFLLYKYLFYLGPFSLFTLVLVVASNHLLRISGPMAWLSTGLSLLITWSVLAMAIGFGARFADFKAESKASALGSPGVLLFLFTAMGYELLLILGSILPAYRLVRKWLRQAPITTGDLLLCGVWLVVTVLAAAWLSLHAWRQGERALGHLGQREEG
ncbi:MAG: putative ABC transporter permease subunit [Thermodesulfobacteriota bacterium]